MVTKNIFLLKKHTERFFALRAGGRFLGIALFLALWHTALPAQDYTLTTQAQVNSFDPRITSITGYLTVFDETGRLLYGTMGDFGKGYNAFNLDRELMNTTGLLYYKVETPTDSAVKKMIQAK